MCFTHVPNMWSWIFTFFKRVAAKSICVFDFKQGANCGHYDQATISLHNFVSSIKPHYYSSVACITRDVKAAYVHPHYARMKSCVKEYTSKESSTKL